MIVLDTNVISELMRPVPSAVVVGWVDRQADITLYVTALTLAEIRYGIAALPNAQRRSTLAAVFEERIRPLFGGRVLGFDETASKQYAELRADARRRGITIGDADALIAAVVKAHAFSIATGDVSPFAAAGVAVINPFEAA